MRAKQFPHGNLFNALKIWSPSDFDRSQWERTTASPEIIISKRLISTCERHGLTLRNAHSDRPTFVLNSDSAKELVHAIASAFKEIEELDNWVFDAKIHEDKMKPWAPLADIFNPDKNNGPSSGRMRSVDDVVNDLLLLSTILEHKSVRELFRKSSLYSHLIPLPLLPRSKYLFRSSIQSLTNLVISVQTNTPAATTSDTHDTMFNTDGMGDTTHDAEGNLQDIEDDGKNIVISTSQ